MKTADVNNSTALTCKRICGFLTVSELNRKCPRIMFSYSDAVKLQNTYEEANILRVIHCLTLKIMFQTPARNILKGG